MKILAIYLIISIILYLVCFIGCTFDKESEISKFLVEVSEGKYKTHEIVIMVISGIIAGVISIIPQCIYAIYYIFKKEEP